MIPQAATKGKENVCSRGAYGTIRKNAEVRQNNSREPGIIFKRGAS